jgi:hypothetical protein
MVFLERKVDRRVVYFHQDELPALPGRLMDMRRQRFEQMKQKYQDLREQLVNEAALLQGEVELDMLYDKLEDDFRQLESKVRG